MIGERPPGLMPAPIKVFVHLASGYDARDWEQRWKNGRIIGINEPFPYGYHRAEQYGCLIEYSHDKQESAPERLLRLGIRALLGFDLFHAWHNLKRMRAADVIWTHTESQYLAILFLFRFSRGKNPKLIAQSVWLMDRWKHFFGWQRWLFSRLIERSDILTFHSPENLSLARQMFPHVRSELVLFGINADDKIPPTLRFGDQPLKILSVGNDEHRDWPLLIDTIKNRKDWMLKIASSKVPESLARGVSNVEIVTPTTNEELFCLFGWADLLVLALRPNLHASGITVIQEAAIQGLPIVCSAVGGLGAYFNDEQVRFVSAQNAAVLEEAINLMEIDPEAALAMAQRAQHRMGPDGLSSESFVRRHVEISHELLNRSKDQDRDQAKLTGRC